MERSIDGLAFYDSGSGAALLLLHGIGSSYNSWQLNFAALEPHFRCVAPDLPGFGASSLPDRYYTVADFGAAMWRLMDALEVPNCHILGHSFGALVATEMTLQQPQRVAKLLLMSAPGAKRDTADVAMGHLIRWVRADGLPALLSVAEAQQYSPIADEMYVMLANQNLRRARGFINSLPAAATYPVTEKAPRIGCETLLLWGAQDCVVPADEAELWNRWIPNSRIRLIEGAGHSPQYETPQQFNQEIVAFFR